MSWYYNGATGDIYELTGWKKWVEDREIQLEKAAALTGAPEVLYGPYNTQAEAQAFASAHPSARAQVQQATAAATQAVTDIPSAIAAASNTAVKLSVRILEAAAGIVLLAIALNAVLKQTTGVDVAGTAARDAKRAGKAAATAAVM